MNRRSLFGIPLVSLFGLRRPAAPPLEVPIRVKFVGDPPPLEPVPPSPNGPTMDDLINLAENHEIDRGYYVRLLDLAIQHTGPVASPFGPFSIIYHHMARLPPTTVTQYARTYIHKASCVDVPEHILRHFRPENRGETFPAGIPFEPLS
jgi:hypothetical protein